MAEGLSASPSRKPKPAEPATPAPALPNGSHPITVEVKVRLQALALPEADGRYSVLVPGLPGCVTMGDSIEEAQANVVDAAEGWLAASYDLNKDEAIRVARGEA
jgi:predicted RNase H-like HicB family nuclease